MLQRSVGLLGGIMMGLGSIIGTGVFVSLGLAAGLSGPYMLVALFLAGMLALCNALSSAQLAAAHPVSGGTYEYGYRFLTPGLGFSAGWLFLCAKSASAATAAIGFGAYFLRFFQIEHLTSWQVGLAASISLTLLTLFGIRRSSTANMMIVGVTLCSLTLFAMFAGVEMIGPGTDQSILGISDHVLGLSGFMESVALLFVAYTGYGRIATLGEEIKNPAQNIPKAILWTLVISFTLYVVVASVALTSVGWKFYYNATISSQAPLEAIASWLGMPWLGRVLCLGAMTAMLGVLLNLILGLSRVIFAMGRNRDLPYMFSRIDRKNHTPFWAILVSGFIITLLVLLNDIKITWSFSAFTVLFYYAITNMAALRLPNELRRYNGIFPWIGLAGCLFTAFWVDLNAVIYGASILLLGVILRIGFRSLAASEIKQ